MLKKLLLVLVMLSLPVFGCEDEIAPSQGPKKGVVKKGEPAGGAKKGPAAKPNAGATGEENLGGIKVSNAAPTKLNDEPIPEAAEDAVQSYIRIRNPKKILNALGVRPDMVETAIKEHFKFKKLGGIDWEKPAAIIWTKGDKEPILVLSHVTREEFMTPLPEKRVEEAQGNEFSFPLSISNTVYVNFDGPLVAITRDWKQFPRSWQVAGLLLEEEGNATFEAHIKPKMFTSYLAEMTKMLEMPPLSLEWKAIEEGLNLASENATELAVLADFKDGGLLLDLELQFDKADNTLVALNKITPTPPASLLSSLNEAPRAFVWQDANTSLALRGLTSESLIAATHPGASLIFARAMEVDLDVERRLAEQYLGPTLWASLGFGEAAYNFFVAPVDDPAKYTTVAEAHFSAVGEVVDHVVTEGKGRAAVETTFRAIPPTEEKPTGYALLTRESDALRLTAKTNFDAIALKEIKNEAPTPFAAPANLKDLNGKLIALAGLDLAQTPEEQAALITLALLVREEGVAIHLHVPSAQRPRLLEHATHFFKKESDEPGKGADSPSPTEGDSAGDDTKGEDSKGDNEPEKLKAPDEPSKPN